MSRPRPGIQLLAGVIALTSLTAACGLKPDATATLKAGSPGAAAAANNGLPAAPGSTVPGGTVPGASGPGSVAGGAPGAVTPGGSSGGGAGSSGGRPPSAPRRGQPAPRRARGPSPH